MAYEHSLTTGVQAHIRSELAKMILQANTTSKIGNTAREIRNYLVDRETLSSPDFVIRRYIQGYHPGLLAQLGPVPDLIGGKRNVPWPREVTDALSESLEKLSREQGAAISAGEWRRYFGGSTANSREKVFRIAFSLKMDAEQTLELLLAFGMEPYSVRLPLDMICLFCQKIGGTYTWAQAKQMYDQFMARRTHQAGDSAVPSVHGTSQVLTDLNGLFERSLQGANAQEALIEYMVENSHEFISFRDKGKEVFLPGYSLGRSEQYLRLAAYLAVLYPDVITPKPRKDKSLGKMDREVWNSTSKPVVSDDAICLPALVRAMFNASGWLDLEWKENAARGSFEEKMRMFCGNYKQHIDKVNRLYAGGSNIAFFDRRDALLFIFFLVSGYMKQLEFDDPAAEELMEKLMDMTESGDPFDEAIGQALARVQAAYEDRDDPLRHFRGLCRAFDLILAPMGHVKLYLPAQFDRFMLLALMSRDPEELASLVMSEAEWESYDIASPIRSASPIK